MLCDEDCRTAVLGKTERAVGWEGNGHPTMVGLVRHCAWGKPAETDRRCLTSLLHSFTLDALALFEREDDAHRVMRGLPLRLGKFGLRLNAQKTGLLGCGTYHARQAFWHGKRPPTFDYLGFTHYWGRTRTGKARLKRKTSKQRLRRAVVEINRWLRQERNVQPLPDLWQAIGHKMRGHFNYFGVTDNSRARYRFEHAVHRLLFKGLHRRSQRRSFTWERFRRYCIRHPLPRPGRLVRLTPVGSMPR